MKKAIIYRQNYIEEMKKYSHFDGYNDLMKKLEAIKNPIDFFNFVSKNELTQDLTYQSDEYYTQEEFIAFLNVLNADNQESINDAISNYNDIKNYEEKVDEQFFL